MIQTTKSGLPLMIPPAFLTETDRASGNVAKFLLVEGQRDLARLASQGSPAVRVGQKGISEKNITCLHSFESQQFLGQKLLNIRNPENGQVSRMGEGEIMRQTVDFKKRQVNLMQASAQYMLLNGKLFADGLGNILPSSSGAAVTVDCEIPAGQRNQLNILDGGNIISAVWSTAGTDIVTQITNMKRAMLKKGGWPMMHAFYGANIPGYIFKNTIAKEWINRNQQLNKAAFAANDVPQGFQNLTWHNVSDAHFIDANGDPQDMIGADDIVFCPDPSTEWWKVFTGSQAVPQGVANYGSDALSMTGDLQEVFGMFGYAAMSHNPVAIEQFAGNNWLHAIAAKYAWCKATVAGF